MVPSKQSSQQAILEVSSVAVKRQESQLEICARRLCAHGWSKFQMYKNIFPSCLGLERQEEVILMDIWSNYPHLLLASLVYSLSIVHAVSLWILQCHLNMITFLVIK